MNKELEAAIRYIKQLGLDADRPLTEYAALSGLSVKTVQRSKSEISDYYKVASSCTPHEAHTMDNRLIDYLITSSEPNSFRDLLGALCGYLLAYKDTDLKRIKKSTQIVNLGRSYLDVLLRILSRKDYSAGVPIHSNSKALTYLKRIDKTHPFFNDHFAVNNAYHVGTFSKRYTLANKAEALLKKLEGLLRKNLTKYVLLLGKHIEDRPSINSNYSLRLVPYLCNSIQIPTVISNPLVNLYQPPYICLSGRRTFVRHKDCIHISTNEAANLSLPSLLHVMGIASLGLDKKTIVVPLRNLSSTNPAYGRHYNIFTRLRSSERKALGYVNYDISGGIQIISFGILFKYASHLYQTEEELVSAYPLIFNYGWNPKCKKKLRRLLSKQLGKSVPEVKELLTAYANGSKKNSGKNDLLQQFRDESDRLRREVISAIEANEAQIRKLAESQSKHTFPEDLDWKDASEDEDLAREKASVYFFIWTYFEKQIRDSMLSLVDDGIPVHDAIYSKRKIPFKLFEGAINSQTGFEVKISH